MKKLFAILLVVVMVIGCVGIFTACGPKADEFKVGAIYITSQNDTAGYTYAHHNGIKTAMKELGLNPDTQLKIVDNVEEEDTAVGNAIDTLAGQGCNIIIGISFGYIDAFEAASKKPEYKDIVFSHATGYKSSEGNADSAQFNNYFGRIYEARYLSGIAAGLKASQGGKIGYVAAWGVEYAETASGINAFALGVQSVNPNAEVLVKVISTWGSESLEKSAAESLADMGCEVIAQHCDSAKPQEVAEQKGIFGVGYNSDMTTQAPNAHITAPIWNWNVYYKLAIGTAKNNPTEFMSKVGNYYGGLKEGFVDISPISKNAAEGTEAKINAVKALMKSDDTWDVFSGVKLSFDNEGKIVMTNGALLKNDNTTVVVEAGGASVDDGVIKGSMDYFVKGVREV